MEPNMQESASVENKMSVKLGRRTRIFRSFLSFLWKEKMWWMIPIILMLGVVALVASGAGGSGIAPLFIYVLF